MTSVAQQQSQNSSQATNAPTNSTVSYASATKKSVTTPPVATGSQGQLSAALAVSGNEPVQQNGKSTASPLNGRSSIAPAVPSFQPAVVHSNNDHTRQSPMTIAPHLANGGPVGGQKVGIQFGSLNSPATSHSTLQPVQSSAPIAIPGGNAREIASPANSPSPIPQPITSGGRPPTEPVSSNGIAFGSLPGGDGDRHMRQAAAMSQGQLNQNPGLRRESSGEMNHQGPNFSRGGYQGGRARGGFNNASGNIGQHQMYNPAQPAFRPGQQSHQGQARGGMNHFANQGRPVFQGSPHQASRSPAPIHSQPGTPNQHSALPMQSPQQQYGGYQPFTPGVNMSLLPYQFHPSQNGYTSKRGGKKNKRGRKFDAFSAQDSRSTGQNFHEQEEGIVELQQNTYLPLDGTHPPSRSQRSHSAIYSQDSATAAASSKDRVPNVLTDTHGHTYSSGDPSVLRAGPMEFIPYIKAPDITDPSSFPIASALDYTHPMDFAMKPCQTKDSLTGKQNYQQYPRSDFTMPPNGYQQQMMFPSMYHMGGGPPQSPQPQFQSPYMSGQYGPPQVPQQMSRSSSQISERPNSSIGQPQTPSHAPATPQASQHKPNPAAISFQRPKSKAIVIKTTDGSAVDLSSLKVPASPAVSNRTRTPPAPSAPTPPPKTTTPLEQQPRKESIAGGKSASERMLEFKEKITRAAQGTKEPEAAVATPSETKDEPVAAVEENKPVAETKAEPEVAQAEKEEVKESKVADVEKTTTVEEPKEVAAPAEDVAASAEEDEAALKKRQQEEEDAELERQIQEMEELEAKREEEQAKITARKAAEKKAAAEAAAAKKAEDDADMDRKMREQEREMERLEDEKEQKRLAAEKAPISVADALKNISLSSEDKPATASPDSVADKLAGLSIDAESAQASDDATGPPSRSSATEKRSKPSALNLAPLNTKPVEAPQPSAALQSLKSARMLQVIKDDLYPEGIKSPAVGVNPKGRGAVFKYDTDFLLQFKEVFTEKPSMEFESQIKSLIGDGDRTPSVKGGMGPRGNSSRGQPGAFAMGNFGAVGGKTLPPGTSSEQRYAMSQGQIPRPGVPGPMASFQRPGGAAFGANPMARIPSQGGMGGMGPNSARNVSQRQNTGRGNSKRGAQDQKQEARAAKDMPLTAGMDLKPIEVSATGWKPRSVGQSSSATGAAGPAPGQVGGHMDPDMVQRKVKAALNKMTPEKFDKIADQILVIAGQSKDETDGRTLRQVIQLTFEKATDEAHWASMYAKFCKRTLETMSADIKDEGIRDKNDNVVSGGNLFRKYLLNRCQEEFERGWQANLPAKPEGEEGDEPKNEEAAMLSDEYYIAAAAKRRGLGLVQFIGELYKLGMLTERIMHECVKKLVDHTGMPDEADIEALTKLLKTIGGNLDSTEKGHPLMDIYFQRIQTMIEMPDMPSRLSFMLMDIVDLRKKNWQSKENNKGPKTLDEIRIETEAAAAQKAMENARGSQRGAGGGGNRIAGGRGDARNFSNQYGNIPPPDHTRNTVASDDLRRLGKSASSRQPSQMSFGPSSMFSSRSNSNRKLGPGGSLSRPGEDSGPSSRTGTPPQKGADATSTNANAFSLLQQLDDNDNVTETPTSPLPAAATEPSAPSEASKDA